MKKGARERARRLGPRSRAGLLRPGEELAHDARARRRRTVAAVGDDECVSS